MNILLNYGRELLNNRITPLVCQKTGCFLGLNKRVKALAGSSNLSLPKGVYQSTGIEKSLFDRKVSFINKVKIKLGSTFRHVKNIVLSRERQTANLIGEELYCFSSSHGAVKKVMSYENVKGFVVSNDFHHEVKKLLDGVKKLDKSFSLFGKDASTAIWGGMKPEMKTEGSGITDLDILAKGLNEKGIVLTDTNMEELNVQLSKEHMQYFRQSVLYKASRLRLVLGGLTIALGIVLQDELIPLDRDKGAEEVQAVKKQVDAVSDLLLGLCQAILKAQMPGFYNDKLYTPLRVSDKTGAIYFRSDLVQPRGGWSDI